jgi:hypothetical protein
MEPVQHENQYPRHSRQHPRNDFPHPLLFSSLYVTAEKEKEIHGRNLRQKKVDGFKKHLKAKACPDIRDMHHSPHGIKDKEQNKSAQCPDVRPGALVSPERKNNPDQKQYHQSTTADIYFCV